MQILNQKYQNLVELAQKYKENYSTAKPFPNIHFLDFFNEEFLNSVYDEFPDLDKEKEKISFKNPNESLKSTSRGYEMLKPNARILVNFLNSQPFLEFLNELTGIKEVLIPDPYFEGGGYHQIKKGGFLKMHADFNKHMRTGIDRRLNVLIYLNKNWKDEYGGHLELWDTDMKGCVSKIPPFFNTLAMFNTTDFSYHGHPNPLNCPDDMTRRSIALYYYSNGRPKEEIDITKENHTTIYKVRKDGSDSKDMVLYNNFINFVQEVTPPFLLRLILKVRNKR